MQTADDPAIENAVPNKWLSPMVLIFYFAFLKLLIHMIFSSGYGYFRDELYYFACGEHLDWGYPDHAPLIALITRVSRAVLGSSLFSIHLLPAISGAIVVLFTGLIARELGGKRFAVVLSCLGVLLAPTYLAIDSFLSMNTFEPVFWMGAVYCFLLALNRNEPRYWLIFGILAGIGLMNKHSTLFFGAAIVGGMIFTKARSQFANRWIWIGGGLALLIFLPNIIWEWRHDWATIELLRNVQAVGKNVKLSPIEYIVQQIPGMGPVGSLIWIAGLVYFLFNREGKRYRALGIAYLLLLLQMIMMHGKAYYLMPIYPMLFSGGGVWIEKLLDKMKHAVYLKVACPALIIISGLIAAPLVLPILPIETLLRYQKILGYEVPKSEVSFDSPLAQIFADRLGWPEMVRKVAEVYHCLPPEDKARAAIFARNYGQAGAIDFFGSQYGLPKAISSHQSYYLWGPGQNTGDVLIVLGARREMLESGFESVEEAGIVNYPYTMSYENYTIYVCRKPRKMLQEVWPSIKFWN